MMNSSRLLALAAALLAVGPAFAAKITAPADPGAVAGQIDKQIGERLAEEKVKPAALADDAEFLRRAYLDIVGVIPPADKAAAFLDSKDPAKRAKLVDELLASPLYAKHMADIWQDLLLPRNSDNRRLVREPMMTWLEEHFNKNTPWDQLVTELLNATGPQDKNGAVTFWLANATVDKFTDQVSKLFLGVQLQCAQCHNHPFTGWKQNEYWGMAQFFMKVRTDNVNGAARNGNVPGVSESNQANRGKNRLPESAKTVPAKFLGAEEPKLASSDPYRPVLAKWLVAKNNPYFARAMVNRTWAHFFGRGLVNPVDDMHADNEPSHPELLTALTESFQASGHDLKFLVRSICASQAYQRTSRGATDEDDPELFARMAVKVLTPEQLFDSLTAVVGNGRGNERPGGKKPVAAAQVARNQQNNPRAQFVAFFLGDENAAPTDYQSGIPQALRLMNSAQMNGVSPIVADVLRSGKKPAENIEQLYLATLARRPTAAEAQKLTDYVSKTSDAKQAYGDVLWALVNSSEFTLNH